VPHYLIMVAPAANRVYAGDAPQLTATELEICATALGAPGPGEICVTTVAGVDYVGFRLDEQADAGPDPRVAALLGRLSAGHALFERTGSDADPLLRPVPLPTSARFSDDLVTIPKYQGKTNEQFTRMLVNVTAASAPRLGGDAPADPDAAVSLLDPLCGRGTTLSVGLTLGYDVAGVESQEKAVEAYAAFLKTYLRRKRIKHKAEITPVRREGRSLGRRLQVQVTPPGGGRQQELTVFTGDTRRSAELYGKRRFDLVVADAPYGVVHGSTTRSSRDRSPADLLTDALPVWARQLKGGGALGIAWNTYGLSREDLNRMAADAGLDPVQDEPYLRLGHRVDSSIHRDVFIARKPTGG
jgi:hypothetical protein